MCVPVRACMNLCACMYVHEFMCVMAISMYKGNICAFIRVHVYVHVSVCVRLSMHVRLYGNKIKYKIRFVKSKEK